MKITINWLRELVEVVLARGRAGRRPGHGGIDVESVEEHRHDLGEPSRSRRSRASFRIPTRIASGSASANRARYRTGRGAARAYMQAGDHVALAPPARRCPTAAGSSVPRFAGGIAGHAVLGARAGARRRRRRGILILPRDAPVGSALVEYLGAEDTVLGSRTDAQSW